MLYQKIRFDLIFVEAINLEYTLLAILIRPRKVILEIWSTSYGNLVEFLIHGLHPKWRSIIIEKVSNLGFIL